MVDDKINILSNPEHDTEDKPYWVKKSIVNEIQFCERICPIIKKTGIINPERITNPYLPDLIVDGRLSELKYRGTPFYTSDFYYNLNPQFTCEINDKDIIHYEKYPELDLFFWINYQEMEKIHKNKHIYIHRIEGVFFIKFQDLKKLIELKKSPRHYYTNRKHDIRGNAESSFLLDVRDMDCLTIIEGSDLFNH